MCHCPTVGDLVHWAFRCVRCGNHCQTSHCQSNSNCHQSGAGYCSCTQNNNQTNACPIAPNHNCTGNTSGRY